MEDKELKHDIHEATCVFSSLESDFDLDILLDVYESRDGKFFALIEVPALYDPNTGDTGVRIIDLPRLLCVN